MIFVTQIFTDTKMHVYTKKILMDWLGHINQV